MKNNRRNNVAALPWQHEVIEHRHSDLIKLREARTACGLSRYFGTRDRPQLWFSGTYILPLVVENGACSTFRGLVIRCYPVNKRMTRTPYISLSLHVQHDPEQCTPGGEDGNFIMFARATSGDKRNNNRFSPCSLNAINPVLNSKARSPKGCFTGEFYAAGATARCGGHDTSRRPSWRNQLDQTSSPSAHPIIPTSFALTLTVLCIVYCRTASIAVRQRRGGGGRGVRLRLGGGLQGLVLLSPAPLSAARGNPVHAHTALGVQS